MADTFYDTMSGNPVPLGFVALLMSISIALGMFVWKVRRDLRRESDERDRKYGRKK